MREKEDKERIEKSLVEMMYARRSRAHGKGSPGRTRGDPAGLEGPESEELLALVQASLRKKLQGLEEDRWMWEGEKPAPGIR